MYATRQLTCAEMILCRKAVQAGCEHVLGFDRGTTHLLSACLRVVLRSSARLLSLVGCKVCTLVSGIARLLAHLLGASLQAALSRNLRFMYMHIAFHWPCHCPKAEPFACETAPT